MKREKAVARNLCQRDTKAVWMGEMLESRDALDGNEL